MEIVFVIGMLAAFLFGAYVRRPFRIGKRKMDLPKKEEVIVPEEKDKIQEQFDTLMNYTGRTGIDE